MLTGPEIESRMAAGEIHIYPKSRYIGPNSVDLTLQSDVMMVETHGSADPEDWSYVAVHREAFTDTIVLHPGRLYIASTRESVEIPNHVAVVYGRSSWARCGLTVHQTAGFIDQGFRGQITLELSVILPLEVQIGARIAQVAFFDPVGAARCYDGRYQNQDGATPQRLTTNMEVM